MRLREVFRYEIEHRIRSGSTWVYAGVLLVISIWISLATGADGDGGVHANAPARLAEVAALIGMLSMLVTAALFADAAARDVEVDMDPLLFSTPLRKAEYLGGRFLATLAANALVLLAIPLGFLAMTALLAYIGPEVLGPFRVATYVQPFLLFLLPNLVFYASLFFSIGMLTRQVIPVYLGAIGILILNVVALNYAGTMQNPIVTTFVDPTGLVTLQSMTRYWTAVQRNTQLLGFPAPLVVNRIVWLGVAAGVFALLVRLFRFSQSAGLRRASSRSSAGLQAGPPVDVPRISGSFGFDTTIRQVLAVAGHSLAEIAGTRWFAVALLGCTGLTMLWGWNVGSTVFDTSTWPVTFLVVEEVIGRRFTPAIYILIAVYAGELVWKAREVGTAEIADAAPVSNAVAVGGRLLALIALLSMFQAASMIGGILIQAFQGYYRFEPALYFSALFGLQLTEYALLAVLAITVHVIVNHKYVGHVMVLMAIMSRFALPGLGVVRHRLLLYATDPGWTYSDMNGFGSFIEAIAWFKLYWAAWAILLAVIACLLWIRGNEPGVIRRLRAARERFDGPIAGTAGAAAVLIVALGGFIFYNTNILNDYVAPTEAGMPQAEYEKRYGPYAALPQPTLANASLRIEIYPNEPAVDLRGTYDLVNQTDVPIDSVHVYLNPVIDARSISFDRAATSKVEDEEVGYRIYALERALAPGEMLKLLFDTEFRPRGFPQGGIQTNVVANGAYFNRSWLPFIGYQPIFELTSDEARARFGLTSRSASRGPAIRGEDLVQFDVTIGTAADQIALTPGVLRRSWKENPSTSSGRGDRSYFHYVTETPSDFAATVFSAKYEVMEDRWQDVELRIFHHPTHTFVLDRTIRSMKASLEYFTSQFGPYPARELRIVEIPRYGGFGRAHMHMISFTEDALLSRVKDGEIDQPFYGTAHEVAHQWWGGQVRGPAGAPGNAFLSESLANYSAMMVTEQVYGRDAAWRVYQFQKERYLTGRAFQSREVPLLDVEEQPYIAYRKGAIAMYMLRDHIGAEAVNTALRRFLDKYRDGEAGLPTSRDLYAELRAVTPESLHTMLEDHFEIITLWDVRADRASVEPTGTGEYQVTLSISAKKVRADGVGTETEVPMDDLVDVGVFAAGDGGGLGEPLYLERHRIQSGERTIRITVPREPARAGIDPHRKMIERNAADNIAPIDN